jgi:hypothetical protein
MAKLMRYEQHELSRLLQDIATLQAHLLLSAEQEKELAEKERRRDEWLAKAGELAGAKEVAAQ